MLHIGDKVTWIYTPRGGYGLSFKVPATVLKICKKKVTISVPLKTGEFVTRSVKHESLAYE